MKGANRFIKFGDVPWHVDKLHVLQDKPLGRTISMEYAYYTRRNEGRDAASNQKGDMVVYSAEKETWRSVATDDGDSAAWMIRGYDDQFYCIQLVFSQSGHAPTHFDGYFTPPGDACSPMGQDSAGSGLWTRLQQAVKVPINRSSSSRDQTAGALRLQF